MNPASLAEAAYHRQAHRPDVDIAALPLWRDVILWHIRHAIIISTPEAFVLARPVNWHRTDHADLRVDRRPTPGCFHIYAAAGSRIALAHLTKSFRVVAITYERPHTRKLHRLTTRQLQRLTHHTP